MHKFFAFLLFVLSSSASCLPLNDPSMKVYEGTNTHMVFDDSDPKSCWHISRSRGFLNCQRFNLNAYSQKAFQNATENIQGLLKGERYLWDSYLCAHVDEIYGYFKDKSPEKYSSIIYHDLFHERLDVVNILSHILKDGSYLNTLVVKSPDIYLESKSMREREKENAQDYEKRKTKGVLTLLKDPMNYEKVYETAKENFDQSSSSKVQAGEYSSFLMATRESVYDSFKALLKSFRYSPLLVETFIRGQQTWDKYVLNHYRLLRAITKGDPKHESLAEARTFLLMMDRKNFLDSWRVYYTTYRKRSDAGWGRGSKEIEEICTSPRPRFLPKFEKLC
jgi:hypothetical protein